MIIIMLCSQYIHINSKNKFDFNFPVDFFQISFYDFWIGGQGTAYANYLCMQLFTVNGKHHQFYHVPIKAPGILDKRIIATENLSALEQNTILLRDTK